MVPQMSCLMVPSLKTHILILAAPECSSWYNPLFCLYITLTVHKGLLNCCFRWLQIMPQNHPVLKCMLKNRWLFSYLPINQHSHGKSSTSILVYRSVIVFRFTFRLPGDHSSPPEIRDHDQLNFAMQANGKGLPQQHWMRREERWSNCESSKVQKGMKQK